MNLVKRSAFIRFSYDYHFVQTSTRLFMLFMIYTFDNLLYNSYSAKINNAMSELLEDNLIEHISSSLLLYSEQTNSRRFLCPYCQSSGRNKKGNPYAPSQAKGFLYRKGNAWNFKCHKCSAGHSFEKFLEIFYPQLHFEYVSLRDQLGTTGFQTNCPTLQTLLKKQGMLSVNPPVFGSQIQPQQQKHLPQAPIGQPVPASTPPAPKVTKLPAMRSPQQQAGHQSRLNHLVKQRQQRRRREPGDSWLG
jgi:hypothetical protein